MKIKNWNIEEMTGYKPITTFYTDFGIAEMYGRDAILDTYNRAFDEWKDDYKYLTELVMVLNWKIWEHNESNPQFADVYNDLYIKADKYAIEHLTEEEQLYFFDITD